jgi:hypothetical protein
MAERKQGWSREFEDPISLPGGRKLVTLRDAAHYITSLPKKESDLPEWQTAIEVLMLVSRGGPTMMARIGVMKALNRPVAASCCQCLVPPGRRCFSSSSSLLKNFEMESFRILADRCWSGAVELEVIL